MITDLVTARRRSLKDVHVEHQPGSDGGDGKGTDNADYDPESSVTAAEPITIKPARTGPGELRIPSVLISPNLHLLQI